jgi:hypothetical protein
MSRLLFLLIFVLSGCGSGAVVFAPTPLPPDLSPLRYEHPGGAFTISIPRHWSVYTQNTATLASSSFTPPSAAYPALTAAVINTGRALAPTGLGDVMNEYQTLHRPDLSDYIEQDRQAMGDGSWRLTGIRTLPGGMREQVNTFIQQAGTFIGILDVIIPNDATRQVELQNAINTFEINLASNLQPTELSTLGFVRRGQLEVVNVASWTNPQGVFFVTGEVANFGNTPVGDVPVRAQLLAADGSSIIEAVDVVMGYSIPPGGFAPFSLRFGQGHPPAAQTYQVMLGADGWTPTERLIYGAGTLEWTEASTFTPENHLLITGMITNNGGGTAYRPLAVVTVFDAQQNVVGAWFTAVAGERIAPGESVPYEVRVMEIGGQAEHYILEIQALTEEQ